MAGTISLSPMPNTSPTPAPSRLVLWLCAIVCGVLLTPACAVTRPTVKIGLVAPFEGEYRQVGYEVIYAVRLAVREANAAGGVAGHTVELVALDDQGDPDRAREQARKLSLDPQVRLALGHWLTVTTQAAGPAYAALGLPFWPAPPLTDTPAPDPGFADPGFADRYRAIAVNVEPGPRAVQAYWLTRQALAALAVRLAP